TPQPSFFASSLRKTIAAHVPRCRRRHSNSRRRFWTASARRDINCQHAIRAVPLGVPMNRFLAVVATLVVFVGIAPSAFAASVAITAGSASFYWDGGLTSFTISSADSEFFGEF